MASFDKAETRTKVVEIITQELKTEVASVGDTATFEQLGADSLDIVQIIMRLEEQFGIEINDEDAERMSTLAQVVDYVHTRRTK